MHGIRYFKCVLWKFGLYMKSAYMYMQQCVDVFLTSKNSLKKSQTRGLGLNIFHSGIKYTEKDWVQLKVQHYPLYPYIPVWMWSAYMRLYMVDISHLPSCCYECFSSPACSWCLFPTSEIKTKTSRRHYVKKSKRTTWAN